MFRFLQTQKKNVCSIERKAEKSSQRRIIPSIDQSIDRLVPINRIVFQVFTSRPPRSHGRRVGGQRSDLGLTSAGGTRVLEPAESSWLRDPRVAPRRKRRRRRRRGGQQNIQAFRPQLTGETSPAPPCGRRHTPRPPRGRARSPGGDNGTLTACSPTNGH